MLGGCRADFGVVGASAAAYGAEEGVGGASGGGGVAVLPIGDMLDSASVLSLSWVLVFVSAATLSWLGLILGGEARGKTRWGRCSGDEGLIMFAAGAACLEGRMPPSMILPRFEKEIC